MKTYDIENAPTRPLTEPITEPLTEPLIGREHHRVATLGGNAIVSDRYRTNILPYLATPRRGWKEAVADLIAGIARGLSTGLTRLRA